MEDAYTLVQRTDIYSCKFFAKVSLMLENLFLVPSLCKLNHMSLCFIEIRTKSPAKLLIPFRESNVFLSHPRCFGPLAKFQHSIKISIKTAHVSRLSISCDYENIMVRKHVLEFLLFSKCDEHKVTRIFVRAQYCIA